MTTTPYAIIYTTCSSQEEAEALAAGLVEARLAACVQQMPIRSTYRWEGRVVRDEEWLLLIKTTAARYPQVEAWIQEHHSYEIPEILMTPVSQGLAEYLAWVDEETRGEETA